MTDTLSQAPISPVRTADPDHLAAGAPLVLAQRVEKQFGTLKVLKGCAADTAATCAELLPAAVSPGFRVRWALPTPSQIERALVLSTFGVLRTKACTL